MKIVFMKKKKDYAKKDMFAVLCLIQSAVVISIIFILFGFSRINSGALEMISQELSVIFGEDYDIGGYFTPSEEKTTAADTAQKLSFAEEINPSVNKNNEDGIAEALSVSAITSDVVMPVNGTVTSEYGLREHPVYSGESFHKGIDIAADEGTPIYSVCDGVVVEADTAEMAGKYVKIQHPDSTETLYCHCSKLLVRAGDAVKSGDVIALVGQTGLVTGPHLHFEYHENSQATDPEKILRTAVNVY